MRRDWPLSSRLLAVLLRLPTRASVSDSLLRDLHDAYRTRTEQGAPGADRWLRRQLFLALAPRRLRDLRQMPARALRAADDVGVLRAAGRLVAALVADLRYSLRLLTRSPGFSLTTIVILTGGLSVSLFTFSLLHTLIYRPLPLAAGDAVLRVFAIEGGRSQMMEGHTFDFVRRNVDSFEVIGGYDTRLVKVRGGIEPRSMQATFIEPSMFDVTGVAPALGRRLLPADTEPGAEPVAVLSHHIWNASFGADPRIVGGLVDLNGVSTRIVGVMPEGFGFPVFGILWLPIAPAEFEPRTDEINHVNVFAKLRPGVSAQRANVELHEVIQRYRATVIDPEVLGRAPQSATTKTFQKAQLGDEADLFFAMMNMAAGFILVLACVNAANLLLARSLDRTRETTIRVAIGASRLRLVTQMMGEGIVMTAVAGCVSIWIAGRALAIFDARSHAALPEGMAFWWRWGMDTPTLVAAAVLIAGTTLLVGGVPAWRVVRADTSAALRDGQQGGQGLATDRLTRTLIVVQIAAIAVLLFLGAMTGHVAYQAGSIDFGIDTDQILIGSIGIDEEDYPTAEGRVALLERLQRAVAASPTTQGVMIRGYVGSGEQPVMADGQKYETETHQPRAVVRAHLGDSAMIGLELRAGRRLGPDDGAESVPVAMVSESLARQIWRGESSLGRRLRVGSVEEDPAELPPTAYTIVGVVSDVVEGNPLSRNRTSNTMYLSMAQLAPTNASVAFRHRGDPRAAMAEFGDTLADVAPTVELTRIVNFDQMFDQMRGMSIAASQTLGGCFGFALILAVGGIYGLTSRSVSQRTQEIGIRRALGATNTRIVTLFLRGSGRRLAVGLGLAVVIGTGASVAVLQFADLDVWPFIAAGILVPTLISGLVLTATWLPTRRAVRLNPRAAIWRE